MPAIIPFIPLIAAGIGAATAGVGIYEQSKQGDQLKQEQKDQQAQLQKQEEMQSAQDAQQRQKMIQANLANAQTQSGGSVNNPTLVDLAGIIAGVPGSGTSGEGKQALSKYLGTGEDTGSGTNFAGAVTALNGGQG